MAQPVSQLSSLIPLVEPKNHIEFLYSALDDQPDFLQFHGCLMHLGKDPAFRPGVPVHPSPPRSVPPPWFAGSIDQLDADR